MPSLTAWLEQLQDDELWALDADPVALAEALSPWVDSRRVQDLIAQYRGTDSAAACPDERLGQGVPGRKWSQIHAFADSIGGNPGAVLEWCAGKGHLGRLLASRGAVSVCSLEWQSQLCEQGARSAQAAGVAQHFRRADVMRLTPEVFAGADTAVALHACGDLHRQLLTLWAQRPTPSLALAPCCYHLQADDRYTPLSQRGRSSALVLQRGDLSQALQETVTTGARGVRLRNRELHWRMAFDEVQRSLRQCDEYLPLPTIPKLLLSGSFVDFVQWALARKQLAFSCALDLPAFDAQGAERARRVRRMELVAKLFRRPLELWLVLDRACYLLEAGAQVSVTAFCHYGLTPRNLLIQAQTQRSELTVNGDV